MEIVEKRLGIKPDYQYRAIRSRNLLQAQWHINKWFSISYVLGNFMGKRILDLGTGSGNFELIFANQTKEIIGIDYNIEAINFLRAKLAEENIHNVQVFKGDLTKLSLSPSFGKFDFIILVDVIEHISKSSAARLVKMLKRYLTINGEVCVITPNYHSPWLIIESFLDHLTVVPKFNGEQHLAKYDTQNLTNLFEISGYQTRYSSTFNLFSYMFPIRALSRFCNKVELNLHLKFGNLVFSVFRVENRK